MNDNNGNGKVSRQPTKESRGPFDFGQPEFERVDGRLKPTTQSIVAAYFDRLERHGGIPKSELTLAALFTMTYGSGVSPQGLKYAYNPQHGCWMLFDPWLCTWRRQDAFTSVGNLIAELLDVIEATDSEIARWCKLAVFRNVLALAQSDLTIEDWDSDPNVLGLPNGELWLLEEGCGVPNQNAIPITQTTKATGEYALKPREECSPLGRTCDCLWHGFLRDATDGDKDMEESLQFAVGASLYGHNRDHRVNILAGDGGTGKSVFVGALVAALGDYAGTAPASVFSGKGDHPTGLAGIADKRFVAVPELNGGMFRSETLKAVSGGDILPVRYMRQDYFKIQPRCTLWITTNEPPALRLVDDAIKRRIRIWPFTHKPKRINNDLGDLLKGEGLRDRVLDWALQGAARYAREGEFESKAVDKASDSYFRETDTVAQWLEFATTESHGTETQSDVAFGAYKAWCEAEGYKPLVRRSWSLTMASRVENRHGMKGTLYQLELG